MAKKIITLCSSGNFYKHVNSIADELEKRGYDAVVPATALAMRQSGDYDIEKVKSWYKDPNDFKIKASKMRKHFEEVAAGNAVLVVNDEKHGIAGYIGPNVLMEIGLAFYLKKPIFILNSIKSDMPVYEEVVGMGSIMLDGDLDKIDL